MTSRHPEGVIVLRETRPDDPVAAAMLRRYVADLLGRFHGRTPSDDEVDGHLTGDTSDDLVAPDGMFLLALDADTVVGCVGLRLRGPSVPMDAAEVKRMFVDPAARGRGVATAMLAGLTERALGAGARRLVLDTRDELTEAIRLYRRLGFTELPAYNANPRATSWWERRLDHDGRR